MGLPDENHKQDPRVMATILNATMQLDELHHSA